MSSEKSFEKQSKWKDDRTSRKGIPKVVSSTILLKCPIVYKEGLKIFRLLIQKNANTNFNEKKTDPTSFKILIQPLQSALVFTDE